MTRLESDLHCMLQWLTDNRMKGNLGRKDLSKLCFNNKGLQIPKRKQVKLIGINIDISLGFEAHIKELCRKV